jgi:hypothetical protein
MLPREARAGCTCSSTLMTPSRDGWDSTRGALDGFRAATRYPIVTGMKHSAALTAGLATCVGLSACGAGDGDGTLRQAADKTRSAPYLVVAHPEGQTLFISPTLTVIKRHGRVVAWTAADHEFTWRATKRCYDRSTTFNRDDVRDVHRAVVPEDLRAVHTEERNGVRVLTGRQDNSTDSADVEFELRLDSLGRVTMLRQRTATFGAIPAGRWHSARYRYPSARQFARAAGPAPTPRCH